MKTIAWRNKREPRRLVSDSPREDALHQWDELVIRPTLSDNQIRLIAQRMQHDNKRWCDVAFARAILEVAK